jgi:hypothetical protein
LRPTDFSAKKTEWLAQVKATTNKADMAALLNGLREELGQLRVAKVCIQNFVLLSPVD